MSPELRPTVGTTAATDVEHGGLSDEEAAQRLVRDGANTLPTVHGPSLWRRLGAQLVNPFGLLLWVAALLAGVAGMPQLSVAIVIVVVLNAAFSFLQEARAERAASRLRALLPAMVAVRRGGRETEVDASAVVRGDILVLRPGDRVPADATVVESSALLIDVSTFSGESVPVSAHPDDEVFAGTFVVEGAGLAAVTRTGAATKLADITRLTLTPRGHHTPLSAALRRFVRTVTVVAVGVGGAFYAGALLVGLSGTDGFILAIGVVVALVPEGLLPTVTLALAWGAERMAHRQVLVRRLEAVETLGSVTFICTDKTGTLTQNQMTVVQAWTPTGTASTHQPGYDPHGTVEVTSAARPAVVRAARAATACSDGYVLDDAGQWRSHGDPMEAALDVLAQRLGLDSAAERRTVSARFPFDARRRRMSVVTGEDVFVKGAPDSVLPLCRHESLDGAGHADAAAVVERFTAEGLRVIAVAGRSTGGTVPGTASEAERDLELYGLLGLEDPPRPDVAAALDTCRGAGVAVAMVTGDHPVTARAIADEVGLRTAADPVYVADDLPTEEGALGELIDHAGTVIARVSPEQKLRIARALRARGHVVAMTGDGVNDGPALHEADVGVAMGASGTDVAREAADIVLLDDHFGSIVAGIEHGRATYVNIRRFITYHLTSNVAELTPFVVWALSGGNFPLALRVLQILAIDIGTDTITAVALGAEPPAKHLLKGPPVRGALLNRTAARRAFAVLGPAGAAMSMLAFLITLADAGWSPGEPFPGPGVLAAASGAAFLAVIFSQVANAFACRSSSRPPWHLGWGGNRLLLIAVTASVSLALVLLWVPPLAHALGHTVPPPVGWAVAAAAAGTTLAVDALDKRMRSASARDGRAHHTDDTEIHDPTWGRIKGE
ncbi:cation-translocating P-type ATPase [Georgenia satyanarayanai]